MSNLNRLNNPTGRILIAMTLGVFCGLTFGSRISFLGEFGDILIKIIKLLATPLVFLAIINAFVNSQMSFHLGLKMISIAVINAFFALIIGLTILNSIHPGQYFSILNMDVENQIPIATPQLGGRTFIDKIPESFVTPFLENQLIIVIIFALLIGTAMRSLKNHSEFGNFYQTLVLFSQGFYKIIEIIIEWFIFLMPVAVFAVVAKTVGENGLKSFQGLTVYLFTVIFALLLQMIFVYHSWLIFFVRINIKKFWLISKEAVLYALGTSSSLATLPTTLRTLKKLGVTDSSASMAACVGTNLNNDGILLYEVVVALFIAQAYQIELNFGQQLQIVFISVVASLGIAGIPQGGLISLSLVLASAKLPTEILPLLLSLDWILSRVRAATNVTADIVNSLILDKWHENSLGDRKNISSIN